MLVGTFQIEVGGVRQAFALLQQAGVGDAGIEPDVEGVAHLHVIRGLGSQQFGRVEAEPGFDAVLFHALGDFLQQFQAARVQFSGGLVHEEGDRHAPVALARDAPVRAVLHHRFQPGAAPGGEELGFVDGAHGE